MHLGNGNIDSEMYVQKREKSLQIISACRVLYPLEVNSVVVVVFANATWRTFN